MLQLRDLTVSCSVHQTCEWKASFSAGVDESNSGLKYEVRLVLVAVTAAPLRLFHNIPACGQSRQYPALPSRTGNIYNGTPGLIK